MLPSDMRYELDKGGLAMVLAAFGLTGLDDAELSRRASAAFDRFPGL